METTRVTVDGSGSFGELESWSVTENATPTAPGDPAAGSGGVQFSGSAEDDSDFLTGDDYTLTHETYGTVSGAITRADLGPLQASLSGDNLITRLSAVRTVPPTMSAGHQRIWQNVPTVSSSHLVADSNGNLYIFGNRFLRKYDPAGQLLATLNTGDAFAAGLSIDEGNNRLVYFGESGSGSKVSYIPLSLSGITATYTNANYFFTNKPYFHSPTQRFVASMRPVPSDPNFSIGIYSFSATFTNPISYVTPNPFIYNGPAVELYGAEASQVLHLTWFDTGKVWFRYLNPASSGILYDFQVDLQPYFPGISLSSVLIRSAQSGPPQAVYGTALELFFGVETGYVDGSAANVVKTVQRIAVFGRGGGFISVDSWRYPDDNAVGSNLIPSSFAVSPGRVYVGDFLSQGFRAYQLRDQRTVALSGVFQRYLDSLDAGLTLDYQATNDPYIAAPGWSDSVWTKLNELCVAHGVEIGIDDGTIVVRDIGVGTLDTEDATPVSRNVSSEGASRFVDVQYTNATAGVGTIYDAAKDGQGRTFEVNVRETKAEPIQTTNYPVALQQPQRVNTFPLQPGQYYLIGSDNLPVALNQFEAYGGSVTVNVSTTVPGGIDLNLAGPLIPIPGVPGPYRLAISDGSNAYPAFSVVGAGVFANPQNVRMSTGADWSKVTSEVNGQALSNTFLATRAQAWDRGRWAAVRASGPNVSVTFSLSYENSNGFGLTAGSTFEAYEAIWRVDSVSFGAMGFQVQASLYTTFGDVQPLWDGGTIGDFAAAWDSKKIKDFRVRPLANAVD